MSEKCKKLAGARLDLCLEAAHAARSEFVSVQTMREMETGKVRDVLTVSNGRTAKALWYCPWCRANLETRPVKREARFQAQGESKGGAK